MGHQHGWSLATTVDTYLRILTIYLHTNSNTIYIFTAEKIKTISTLAIYFIKIHGNSKVMLLAFSLLLSAVRRII